MKRNNKIAVLSFVFFVIFAGTLHAQNASKYSNEFLTLGVGARAMGMSNANIAMEGDVYSGYWNPAGLVDSKDDIQTAFMHSAYFAGIANYDYLGITAKVKENSAIGFSLIRFGVDGILNTFDLIRNGEINYDRITQFSAVDYAFMLHYAQTLNTRKLNEYVAFQDANLSFGANAKIINRQVGPFASAWGFGIDAGLKLSNIKGGWSFGFVARDVTTTFNAWNFTFTEDQKNILLQTFNEIPVNSLELTLPRFVFGAAKKFSFSNFDMLAVLDLETTTDGKRNTLIKSNLISIDPRLGVEMAYKFNEEEKNKIFLRLGTANFQQETNLEGKKRTTFMPTIGVGVQLQKNFTIDYALTDIGDQSAALYSNVISLKIAINK